jgi:chromate reductase, NAD(P)H dehydrogenase (quinone)
MDVVAICGSLRAGSYNRMLLRHLAARAGDGVTVEIVELRGIPVYDGDLETRAFPPEVTAFKDRIARCDALVIGSPEYNWSLPGALKNAIDWASRPGSDIPRVFGGRPTGLVGATPGPGGTRMAQVAWLPVLRTLGTSFFPDSLFVPQAGSVFDASGAMVDPKTAQYAEKWMTKFVAFARR